MADLLHPLRAWMKAQGYEATDYEVVASLLPSRPASESIRQIACGYRPPGWDLAFEIEGVTGISAREMRDPKWYRSAA